MSQQQQNGGSIMKAEITLGQGIAVLVTIVSMIISAWVTTKVEIAELKVKQTNTEDNILDVKNRMEKEIDILKEVRQINRRDEKR
jgi:mannitol-specific phosphotransferase system IIBC component